MQTLAKAREVSNKAAEMADKALAIVSTMMETSGLSGYSLSGRGKSVQSIMGKLEKKPGRSIESFTDLVGIRICLSDLRQAYKVAEILGAKITDDYIQNPKPVTEGGYAGRLHCSLKLEGVEFPIELQIGSRDITKVIKTKVAGDDLHGAIYKGNNIPEFVKIAVARVFLLVNSVNLSGLSISDDPFIAGEISATIQMVKQAMTQKGDRNV